MFNNSGPLVPPMKNVVGNTHAETRAEIEARARAEQAAQAAMYAAAEEQSKKSPWMTILISLFAFIAVGAAIFAIYESSELQKSEEKNATTEATLTEEREAADSLKKEIENLKTENTRLKALLEANTKTEENTPEETPESTPETTPETPAE